MPKRSLIAKSLTFREKRMKPELAKTYAPSDLNDINLLDLVENWLNAPESLPLMKEGTNDCVKLRSVSRVSKEALLVDTYSGKSGEESDVFAPGSDEPVQHISQEQAVAGHTRVLFFVPEHGEVALMFSEICMRGTSGTRIFNEFSSYFSSAVPGIKMDSKVVRESPEWLRRICAVQNVSVKSGVIPRRASSLIGASEGSYEITVKSKRNMRYSPEIILKLQNDPKSAIIELGLPEATCMSDIQFHATVEGDDGRVKTIDLFDDSTVPFFRRILSESKDPELQDEQFVVFCEKYAETILDGYGQL